MKVDKRDYFDVLKNTTGVLKTMDVQRTHMF